MGGRALIGLTETRRYAKDEFLVLCNKIEEKLRKETKRYELVPWIRSKESFGDLDILAVSTAGIDNRKIIEKVFAPKALIHNGGVFSFNVEELQVDLICVKEEDFETALAYFSHNDAGILLGRVAKDRWDLKLGHQGLSYPVRINDNTHLIKEVPISKNPERIWEFCGYNFENFKKGFETLHEMFWYICGSEFFNRESYDYAALNHKNRTRNRKRENYRKFLEFLEENKDKLKAAPQRTEEEKKELMFKRCTQYFPEAKVKEITKELTEKAKAHQEARTKILEAVKDLNLSQKEVGEAMSKYRKDCGTNEEFSDKTLKLTNSEIKERFKKVNIVDKEY